MSLQFRSFAVTLPLFLLGSCLIACSESEADDEGDGDSETRSGESIYSERHPDGNTFACATCHALSEPTADGFTRPGHPIAGAPRRASFKNGQLDSFLGAVNSCLDEWMVVPEPWTEESPEFVALRDYLDVADSAGEEEVSYSIVEAPEEERLLDGDPDRGRETFDQTCAVCHGEGGGGTQKAPPIVGFELEPGVIAGRIRLSGSRGSEVYDGLIGGRMPFWSQERLSDEDLLDIVAFVAMGEASDGALEVPDQNPGEGTEPTDPPVLPEARSCDSTHEKIGQVATLLPFAHDVGGTVTIVDDCTLEFSDFTFDGNGINVQIYGALGGAYGSGFSMTGDLRRDVAYDGASFRVNLPEGMTLDDLDGVSVWCVPVGATFGDGLFE